MSTLAIMDVKEFAKRWGVSTQWIRQLIKEEEILAAKMGKTWVISEAEYRRASKSTGR